jgi:hypothetical protein
MLYVEEMFVEQKSRKSNRFFESVFVTATTAVCFTLFAHHAVKHSTLTSTVTGTFDVLDATINPTEPSLIITVQDGLKSNRAQVPSTMLESAGGLLLKQCLRKVQQGERHSSLQTFVKTGENVATSDLKANQAAKVVALATLQAAVCLLVDCQEKLELKNSAPYSQNTAT